SVVHGRQRDLQLPGEANGALAALDLLPEIGGLRIIELECASALPCPAPGGAAPSYPGARETPGVLDDRLELPTHHRVLGREAFKRLPKILERGTDRRHGMGSSGHGPNEYHIPSAKRDFQSDGFPLHNASLKAAASASSLKRSSTPSGRAPVAS